MDGSATAPLGARRSTSIPEVPAVRALPEGAILLHVGPHKTGTSSVQSAFHVARRPLAALGVRYAGPNRHPVRAAQAAIGGGSSGRSRRPWDRLVRRLRRDLDREPSSRIVLSSEWFADASPEAAQRIVGELGAARVHVVVTLRPLDRLLPSQWQQHIQAGLTRAYEPWLADVLADPPAPSAAAFWRRHRQDELVGRWAAIVGPDRVTAIVVDDRDHGAVLRAFESLLGVPSGVLVPEDARLNRSLSLPEAELMRALNEALRDEGLDSTVRLNLVLYGVAAGLRAWRSPAGDRRIEMPSWSAARIASLSREMADGVTASGIGIVGDIGSLVRLAPPPSHALPRPSVVPDVPVASDPPDPAMGLAEAAWADLVAVAAVGVLCAAGAVRGGPWSGGTDVVSTSRLGEVLVERLREASIAPLRAVVERPPRATTARAAHPASATERLIVAALERELRAWSASAAVRERAVSMAARAMAERDAASDAPPTVGAAAILGVVRSTGLGRPLGGPAAVRAIVENARRRRTGETVELSRLPTVRVAALLSRRLVRGLVRGRSVGG